MSSGQAAVTSIALENAKASVMSGIVSRESTVGHCGMQSLMNALRRSGPGHNGRLLSSVAAVTSEQVLYVIKAYLLGLFSPQSANVFITTSPGKFDEVFPAGQRRGAVPGRACPCLCLCACPCLGACPCLSA